ncbi:DUF1330 domain-containing protein [Flavicella sediminum]|uniref:DUF1330 domain-containing protein n=1 Tax=Flavicella sediminum TaxID=2585141 RepID=UPI0011220431|nr:DUF1330 domain-containing protein [Flavicella sediminum]
MLYITAFLFVKEGKEHIFQEYENLVLPLLKKYNGELIYRVRPKSEAYIFSNDEKPYEIHLLTFPSDIDFKNYVNDEERKSFEQLKIQAIKTSFLVKETQL